MGYWGKIIGGVAGFAMGGPMGRWSARHSAMRRIAVRFPICARSSRRNWVGTQSRLAAMFNRRDQLFAICAVVLSAKLAKCDGQVKREEIDAFKRQFRIPPEAVRDIGRLFDQARDSSDGFEPYAVQLGEAFADNRGMLEDVLAALFVIARADGPVNGRELDFCRARIADFDLTRRRGTARAAPSRAGRHPTNPTPIRYSGSQSASDEEIHATWKGLMRENHPDSLAARGVPAEFIARANEKVARINAAWDRIKRERGCEPAHPRLAEPEP